MMRIPRIYNSTSSAAVLYACDKRVAYIEYDNAVENPMDSFGDVATRAFGF
jgi:hypothetical protein